MGFQVVQGKMIAVVENALCVLLVVICLVSVVYGGCHDLRETWKK